MLYNVLHKVSPSGRSLLVTYQQINQQSQGPVSDEQIAQRFQANHADVYRIYVWYNPDETLNLIHTSRPKPHILMNRQKCY